ncbi:hypothetical protein DL767_004152 [Monosporascus sp. MG133]|nr:hypothetical protein DL767_004152 [Monosporascus sp. MG133]
MHSSFRSVICQFQALRKLAPQRGATRSVVELATMRFLLCCTARPLMLSELIGGMALDFVDNTQTFNPKSRLEDLKPIQHMCPGFLEVNTNVDIEEPTKCTAHFSLPGYLESDPGRQDGDVKFFTV